jgi:hypothetical protein
LVVPLRHRFSQRINFFGVQDLISTLEELPNAGPMQFQLGPADPECTKGKLLLSRLALVGCLDPADAERRLRIAVGDQFDSPFISPMALLQQLDANSPGGEYDVCPLDRLLRRF